MKLYSILLHIYPRSFRLEYGEEMRRLFAPRLEAASGPLERLGVWVQALADIISNASLAHIDILGQDLRFTLRSLARTPGYTLASILVAALGIGATTAAFSVTDRVLIRDLPFRDADRLVKVWQKDAAYSRFEASPGVYRDWKGMAGSFESMGAYTSLSASLVSGDAPLRLQGAAVTADLLPLIGAAPLLGRLFTPEEDREGAAGTLILSYGLWRDAFGSKAAALGATVRIDEAPFTVVGVMPPSFAFPDRDTRFWSPLRLRSSWYEDRSNTMLRLVAKLKRGVTLEAARADMDVVTRRLKEPYPKDKDATVVMLSDEVPWQARLLLLALLGAALCLLLIACTNLASLLIARSLQRQKELAVRTALGAGRERLVRQLITESVTLALCGGLLGIALAYGAAPLLSQLAPTNLPLTETSAIDGRILLFAALMTLATGVAFGVIPALALNGEKTLAGLRAGARGGGGRRRLRSALVLAQVAISVVLLVSCGLLIRALWRVQQTDPGFKAEGVLTARTSLPMPRYEPTEKRGRFYDQVLNEVRALPGVKGAAFTSFLPMVMRGGIWDVRIAGRPENQAEDKVSMRFITPEYFATLGIPVLKGREFNSFDTRDAPAVIVVSRSFAEKYWPNQEALGLVVNITFADRIIVGVADNVRVRGLERESEPQVYLSHLQIGDGDTPFYAPKDLAIRVAGDPGALASSVREIVKRADPMVPVSDVRTMADVVEAETASRRTQLLILQAFALLATILAGVGIHGLLAFTLSHRLQEVGVRIALGAAPDHIFKLVVSDGARLAAGGALLGLSLAYFAGRSLEALLAGVDPGDPVTFVLATLVIGLMTLGGSLHPALKAVRVNPTLVMKSE